MRASEGDFADRPWTELSTRVLEDIHAGKPLVVQVWIPLCSNDQIDCGGSRAGKPGDLGHNIYWDAIFGAKRFFEKYRSPFERVELADGPRPMIQKAVYRRRVAGTRWGREASQLVEQIVVLRAIHGDDINRAVEGFWSSATEGSCESFRDGERTRTERVHVVGYAGHNRLMDGVKLPAGPSAQAAPLPTFVLACASEPYFGPSLRAAGARPLLTTRALMAPEGYLVRAAVQALGENESPKGIRQRTLTALLKWQKSMKPNEGRWLLAPFKK